MSFHIALLSISLLLPLHCERFIAQPLRSLEQQLLSDPRRRTEPRSEPLRDRLADARSFPPALFRLRPMSCRVQHAGPTMLGRTRQPENQAE